MHCNLEASLFGVLLWTTVTSLACDDSSAVSASRRPAPPVTDGSWFRPSVDTTWQWQLVGTVNTAYQVDVYDIDLELAPTALITELHAAGRRVLCYFSAGTFEPFRPDADRFPRELIGEPLEDFPDEQWLDIRSPALLPILLDRLDLAVQKGCDGVEPDNVDGFENESGFGLSETDQLAFNARIANEAHARNLFVALKNDIQQAPALVDYFDLLLNEQCHEFEECDRLAPFVEVGKPAFVAEYQQRFAQEGAERDQLCRESRAANLRTLVLPLDLDDSFRFSCDE